VGLLAFLPKLAKFVVFSSQKHVPLKTLQTPKPKVSWKDAAGALLLAGAFAFSVLMLTKVVPYFSFQRGIHFLSTKTDRVLDNPYFMAGFYVHITSSLWVMAGGVFQFVPALFRRKPAWHRLMGKVYVLSVLLLAAPSGLVLAFFANGGLPAKVGFALQCVVWWLVTFAAWQEIRNRRWLPHTEWMIRSYAVTLAAVSLRTESYVMYYFLGTKPIETYLTVTWLSWTGNLLVAEILIRFGAAKRLLGKVVSH
jgi:hypothetical protein